MAQKETQLLKLIPLTTGRWEETHGAKPSGFSCPCAGHYQWSQPSGTCEDPITTAHSLERNGAEQKGN